MTTLIAVYTSSGCVGRCDAKCYDAKHPDCDCICGGRNHGAGLDNAAENTREMVDTWLDDYHKAKGLDPAKTHTYCALDQQNLFDVKSFSQEIRTA